MENSYRTNNIEDNIIDDIDLPDAPRLEIYEETFDGLINVTDKWYKENRV